MKPRVISIGAQGFEDIRKNNYFYVDKTDFIREWWEAGDSVTLITRPRRFGKTLNMSMLECFFSVKYAGRFDLFDTLKIWTYEKYRAMQGTWPVISLSFAKVKAPDFENAKREICAELYNAYQDNRFLLDGTLLTDDDKRKFLSVNDDMSISAASDCINRLCKWLYLRYGKKVIVLLDEYDAPMQEAWVSGYWDALVGFLSSLFNATFKTNPYMERGIMTGITRISKESIFSDLNNLNVITTTSSQYETAFGFTEEEVIYALEEMGLEAHKGGVKQWYDGFTFGDIGDIYNPWSITCFLDKKKYMPYWVNTSGNKLVNKLIRESSPKIKQVMEDLISGRKNLRCKIDEQIIFNQLNGSTTAVWSLLLAGGYLKVVAHPAFAENADPYNYIYELALTNLEVKIMFEELISQWFCDDNDTYNDFVRALLRGDVEEMNIYLNKVMTATFSYFDTGTDTQPERFYHAFVLGLIVELRRRYLVTSNRESGYGRYDVMLEPLNAGDTAYIIEFKVRRNELTLDAAADEALKQIDVKNYAALLEARNIQKDRIKKYGFAFDGKKVLIKE